MILGIKFDNETARPMVGNVATNAVEPIQAFGFPEYFAILYRVTPGSELTVGIDEVRVVPESTTTKCRLPTITPVP